MRFVGENLKRIRKGNRLTIAELSSMTGIPASYISQIEHGIKNPRPAKVDLLAAALKVPQAYFYDENAGVVVDMLPTMPPDLEQFVMGKENTPWLRLSEKAKREGISPEALDKLIDVLKMSK